MIPEWKNSPNQEFFSNLLVLRCQDCSLFIKFVSKKEMPVTEVTAKAYAPVAEQIGLSLVSRNNLHEPCHERFEKLERKFAGYDTALTILTWAVLGCGMLKGKGSPPLHDIDSDLVNDLCEKLYESEAKKGDRPVSDY